MDWDLIISVISDLVKDDSTRHEIYKKFMEAAEYTDRSEIIDSLDQDPVFDNVWERYFADTDQEENWEDEGYDYDEE